MSIGWRLGHNVLHDYVTSYAALTSILHELQVPITAEDEEEAKPQCCKYKLNGWGFSIATVFGLPVIRY